MRRVLFITLMFITAKSLATIPSAYQRIALNNGIPAEILYAIAMQESRPPTGKIIGVKKPWPWTLNCEGQGYYFPSKTAAFDSASFFISSGLNCDIGLMQVSWLWHKNRFESLKSAFEPYTNIQVGADILKEQYQKTGSWEQAIGAYHSPSDKLKANQYRDRVRSRLAGILGVSL